MKVVDTAGRDSAGFIHSGLRWAETIGSDQVSPIVAGMSIHSTSSDDVTFDKIHKFQRFSFRNFRKKNQPKLSFFECNTNRGSLKRN